MQLSSPPPWLTPALTALALALAGLGWYRSIQVQRTYVFTPLIDVVPDAVPLSQSETAALQAAAQSRIDARDIQKAYARLGSTLSLDDLLRGVEALDKNGQPLSPAQAAAMTEILTAAQKQHAEVFAVQDELLRLESQLDRELDAALAALPPEKAAQLDPRNDPRKPGPPR